MKKSIFLFFAAILCAMSVSANMVYLKPGNWLNDGADVWVHSWGGTQGDVAGVLKPVGLGLYGLDIKNNTKCLFVRQSGGQSGINWNSNWYKTGDLIITSGKECYHVSGWDVKGWIAVPSAYIAGATELTGFNWSANAAANKMTKQSNGTWTLTKTIESIAKGDYEYKVTDGSWDWSFGEGSNNKKINIPATGKYEVTFTYTPSPEKVSATATPIYSVTVNAGEGGSATGTGECKNGASITIEATASENYEFVNWTITTGTGSFDNENAASTTFYPTSNTTIQANFRSTLTYSLTVQGGTGIESVTGDNNNVTLGDSYAITATLTDGYKFVGWTADVAANAEIANASAASTSVVVKNGSVVLTASAKEYLSTLTTANAYSEGDAGLAIPTATVSEIGVVTTADVEATPACVGYVFANWTLTNCERIDGGAANATSITVKSKGDGAEASVVANYTKVPTATVYFVNNKSWSTIKVYAWGGSVGENASWSGLDITANKETEKLGEFDVYSYTVNQGAHANLIFNDGSGDDSKKTSDYVWADGKYYYMGANKDYAGSTKEEITTLLLPDPLATEVYLAGEMTNWGDGKIEFKKATIDATTASVTVNLTTKTYKFKLIIGEGNWRGNTGTMKRGGESVHEGGWSFEEEGGDDKNCQIVADIAGDYTFTWNLTDKKLTVAYPPLPKHQVTATVNPAETGTVTGMGKYEQGSTATLVAAPAANYAFKNWTEGGEEVSTEATYSFKVTKAVELVANFVPEVTHEVTVSYICNSNPIPGHAATTLAVGVTTPSTITAPAITHYTFDGWTLGAGIQTEDDATDNPIHITTKAEGGYTLTANYTKIELTYTVKVPAGTEKCYIAGEMTSWSFQEMTPTANANEFTITIDGATTDHKYKYACGPDWAYVEKKEDGSELDADRTYNANDVVAKWAEPAKCYLMGIGGDWTTGIEMEEDGDQFKLLCQPIAEGEQFKFKYGDTWTTDVENYDANGVAWVESYPGSGQYNITLPAGNYDFYYKKNENKVWIGVCTPATPTPDYTRTTTAGNFGTICLPYGGTITGAVLYECVGRETGKVYLASVTTLEAGVPYIFQATATELAVYSDGTTAPAGNHNGLYGTFDNETVVAEGDYILLNNELRPSDGTAKVNANRAYLVMSEVSGGAPQQMPGRRYIGMSVQGENEATGLDNITNGENTVIKTIENGQLIIIRNGEKFNAQGVRL